MKKIFYLAGLMLFSSTAFSQAYYPTKELSRNEANAQTVAPSASRVSDYNDTWLNEVSKLINRYHYLPDMYIEHMHFVVNKGPKDQTHMDRLKRKKRFLKKILRTSTLNFLLMISVGIHIV